MGLTGKDATATLVMAVSTGLYGAYAQGTALPLIDGARGTAAVLLILGVFGGCAMGRTAGPDERMPDYTAVMCLLGIAALVAAVAGLFTGNGTAIGILFAASAVMWLLATIRHAFLPRPALVRRREVPPDVLVAGGDRGADTLPGLPTDTLPGVGLPAPSLGIAGLGVAGLRTAGLSAVGLDTATLGIASLSATGAGMTGLSPAGLGNADLGNADLGSASLETAGLDTSGVDAAAFRRRAEVSDLRDYGTSKRRVPSTHLRRNERNGWSGLLPW